MHLLYLDESGVLSDPAQHHFVLAGVSIFERRTHWIEQALNKIAASFCVEDHHLLELHGSPMRNGKDVWKKYPKHDRLLAIKQALKVGIADRSSKDVRLFGVVIKKSAASGEDPVELAFEQLTHRFDLFLKRLFLKDQDAQRGLILLDKSSTEHRFKRLPESSNTKVTLGGKPKIMRKCLCS